MTPDVDAILAVIHSCRFRHANESDLQAGLARALTDAGYEVQREVRLNARDRIDLLVARVGIEVKVAGVPRDVERQLGRYARSDLVDALVLVTTRARHRPPDTMHGKPVRVASLLGAAL